MTQIGNIYGEALYALAAEEQIDSTILQQMLLLKQSFESEPKFLQLLSSPALSKVERCNILDESFRPVLEPYLLNFLKLLTEKAYIRHFPHCFTAYERKYNEDHNILPVTAVSASALNADQIQRLKDKLAALTGKTINLSNRIDAGCLGGVRLDYDGKCLDDTVSHRLDKIHRLLKNTVL